MVCAVCPGLRGVTIAGRILKLREDDHLFFEGNGPARQGLCGLDFRPCLSSELSLPSVPLAAARARDTRQQWSCGPEATAAL